MRARWPVRFARRTFGRCPWCAEKMTRGFSGILMPHGVLYCPRGHYAEEDVMGAGTIVYSNGGAVLEGYAAPSPSEKEPAT